MARKKAPVGVQTPEPVVTPFEQAQQALVKLTALLAEQALKKTVVMANLDQKIEEGRKLDKSIKDLELQRNAVATDFSNQIMVADKAAVFGQVIWTPEDLKAYQDAIAVINTVINEAKGIDAYKVFEKQLVWEQKTRQGRLSEAQAQLDTRKGESKGKIIEKLATAAKQINDEYLAAMRGLLVAKSHQYEHLHLMQDLFIAMNSGGKRYTGNKIKGELEAITEQLARWGLLASVGEFTSLNEPTLEEKDGQFMIADHFKEQFVELATAVKPLDLLEQLRTLRHRAWEAHSKDNTKPQHLEINQVLEELGLSISPHAQVIETSPKVERKSFDKKDNKSNNGKGSNPKGKKAKKQEDTTVWVETSDESYDLRGASDRERAVVEELTGRVDLG